MNDPNTLAAQRLTDLRDRQTSYERRMKMLQWSSLPAESLVAMKEQFEKEKEELGKENQRLRGQYVSKLEEFLKSYNTDPKFEKVRAAMKGSDELIAQVTLRLAELYALQAIDNYGADMERWNTAGNIGPEPKLNYGKAQNLFAKIVADYPKATWASDALYSLAYIKSEQATPEVYVVDPSREAAKLDYLKLIEEYPESRYREESYFAMGSYWFSYPPKGVKITDQLDSAEYYFKEVLNNPKSTKYEQALYMLGWISFRRPDYGKAVEYFEMAINYPYDHKIDREGSSTSITTDATNYIATIFAEPARIWDGSGVANALKYVAADSIRAQRFGVKMLEILGDQLARNLAQFDSAVVAWQGAVAISPYHERSPFIQQKVVESAFRDLRNMQLWYAEGNKLFNDYKTGSPWWDTSHKAKVRKAVKQMVRDTYQQVASFAVNRAINKESPDYDPKGADEAVRVCKEFINAFPTDSAAYEWNYQLANLLSPGYLNRPEEAFAEYQKVVTAYTFASYRKPASEQMLLVAEELTNEQAKTTPYPQFGTDSTTGLPTATRSELTQGETMMMAAAENYVKLFPDDVTIAPAYLYNAGRINYQRGRIPEANDYFVQIIQKYQTTKYYEPAYKNYAEGYLVMRDFAGAERVATEIEAASVSDTLKQFANERKAAAIFSSATTLSLNAEKPSESGEVVAVDKTAQYEKAGDEYMRVAMIPNFKDADLSLENAAAQYRKANKLEKVIEAYNTLATKFPGSKRAPRALYNAGLIQQTDLKRPAEAAATFDRLVSTYPASEEYDVKQATINASFNYEQAQDYRNAVRINQLFAERYPTDENANQLLFKTAGLYLKMDDVASANRIYDDFSRKFPDSPNAVLANFERGKYAQDRNDLTTARQQYQAAYDRHMGLIRQGKSGNAEYASKALAQIVGWDLETYKAIRYAELPQFKEGVTARKDKKIQRQELFDRIKIIIEMAQAEQFQALHWAGELDENLAETHLNQKREPTKKPEEAFNNRQKIIDEAIAIYQLSVDAYASSLDQYSTAVGVLDNQRAELAGSITKLQEWIDVNGTTAGIVDSTVMLDAQKKALDRVETALSEARKWQAMVREKAPEMAFRKATLKQELVYGALELPDAAVPGIKDPQVGRSIYRQQVLQGFVGQFASEAFQAYMDAIKVAREAGYEEKWAVPARAGMKTTIDTLLYTADELNERWFTIYEKNSNAIQDLLPKGAGARDKQNREVYKISSEMQLAVEYYAGELGVTTVMNAILGRLLEQIATDTVGRALQQPAIDAVITWYSKQAGLAEKMKNEAATAEATAKEKFRETSQYQFEDAYTGYESVRLTFSGQQRDLLATSYDFTEKYGFSSSAMGVILQKLAELDPETYGAKVGIQLTENWIGSDETWISTDTYIEGYPEADLDVSNWRYATASQFTGVALDSFMNAQAKPIHGLKAGETASAGMKRWFRKPVWITERITSAEMRIIGDDKISVFVNKEFIYETQEDTDWKATVLQDVSSQLKPGYNVIAVELSDVDGSGGGFIFGLKYKTVPGSVSPILPEPPNAATMRNIGTGGSITAPAQTPEVKPEETQPAPVEQAPATPVEQPTETPSEQPVEQQPTEVQPETTAPAPTEQPVAEPVTEPVQEPVVEPAQQPVTEPAAEPVTEPVVEPVSEPVTEPVQEPVAEPLQQPVTQPVVEPVQQPVTEPVPEPVQEPVVEPQSTPPDTTKPAGE
ncbi:MAG: tetratricopeptide repeat protein [bacterium]|nr:tetratricopeptide repeat protein [bacterium]